MVVERTGLCRRWTTPELGELRDKRLLSGEGQIPHYGVVGSDAERPLPDLERRHADEAAEPGEDLKLHM